MAKFLFLEHGRAALRMQEEGAKTFAAWGAWFEKIGEKLVEPGNPVGQSHTVSKSGAVADGGANPVSGYTVIDAADIEAAKAIAADCPMVTDGSGTVEVAEIVAM